MGAGKHTDFHLESSKGCELYLFRNGEIVDKLPSEMKKQPAPNIAYGRKTDGIAEWGYQLAPTPGYCNCGQIVSGDHILGDPIFSIPGKVTTNYNILSLDLSIPQNMPQGTVIRYTTDCTEPTENSTQFTDPILIYETTIVRAKLFCQGYLSPRSVTQSYIFFPRKVSLPVVSIATDIRYFKDRCDIAAVVEENRNTGLSCGLGKSHVDGQEHFFIYLGREERKEAGRRDAGKTVLL